MRKTGIAFILLCLIQASTAIGQVPLTLKQCVEYAASNNRNIKISHHQEDILQKKISEKKGSVLPQVSASGSLDDNLSVATQLLPGELAGKPGTYVPVKFGTKYNASGAIQLNQSIFDPSYKSGLQAAKTLQLQSIQNTQKTEEQVASDVSKSYYQALIYQKQIEYLKTNYETLGKVLASTELKYKNGIAKKLDVNKIRVNYNIAKSQLTQAQLGLEQSLNTLKFQMGMTIDKPILLADTTLDFEKEPVAELSSSNHAFENRVDYQLQKTNLSIQQINRQNEAASYLPTVSFNGKYSKSAMRQEFNIFNASQAWFKSSSIGLNVSIPIFSGFQKKSKVQQADINILVAQENIKQTEESIKVDISNAEIAYKNALDNINNEKANYDLAQEVYKDTQLQFEQGSGTSIDLIQSETSMTEAQNNYINKLLNLYIARIDLEQSRGTLLSFIKNK